MHISEFIQTINAAFHARGMFCTLSDGELGNYLLEKVMNFMKGDSPHTLLAVKNIGQQDVNNLVFILSLQVCVTHVY